MNGNCQFAAVANQLSTVCGLSVTADVCRSKATEWIGENRKTASRFVTCSCSSPHENYDDCWKRYLLNMTKNGTFGDQLMAMSVVYGM